MMPFADDYSWQGLLVLLERWQDTAYFILFLGSFFETLIPLSFFVYGEIFFLSGAMLAGMGSLDILLVGLVLIGGGILGDNCSYWLGRRYGFTLFTTLGKWPLAKRFFTPCSYQRGLTFFRKKGDAAVFLARLCGPFSWFVPALSGAFGQRYHRFVMFNSLGVILGIGEFLVIGYFFGSQLETVLAFIGRTTYWLMALFLTTAAFFWMWINKKEPS